MNIDQAQAEAIRHHQGPALVLAGPGAGKTLVITQRIKYLIEEYHVSPEHILVITFTRAAAGEMKARFLRLIGSQSTRVSFGTFHAVYFSILKYAYGYTGANIVREEERNRFIREYIHRLRLEYDDEAEFISDLVSEISRVKNEGYEIQHYYSKCCGENVFRNVFCAYQEFLDQHHYLDFDDMLVFTKELLEQRKDILSGWQKKFRYILIDEFQDINRLQFDIIRMLALPENNMFVVGDDDQSIYRFRGAKPEIMLRFPEEFPNTARYLLGTNYRSGKEIVSAAGHLISHNKVRFDKEIQPHQSDGLPVIYQSFSTQKEQNLYVINEVQKLHREGMDYCDMAVLCRTNRQPLYLMEQLMEYNIPFTSRDRIPDLYDHWIARDLMAYIALARGDRSRAMFLKIMNRPKRYLSRESLPYETVDFRTWETYYRDQDWMMRRIEKLRTDLEVVARMRPYSAINYIRMGMGYEDFLKEYSKERKMSEDDLLDVLEQIQEQARGFQNFTEWLDHIEEYRSSLQEQQQSAPKGDALSINTLHSAKGLEYDTVFLVDVNEGVMPYKKAALEADVEEERRMFYVGMTRAKRKLYLLYSDKINNKEKDPSRFLTEIGILRQMENSPHHN